MVYNGVPSRGCYLCRSRKIKCDETKPFCNRCRKSKRQCPGYPVLSETHSRPYADGRKSTAKGSSTLSNSSSSSEDDEYFSQAWVATAQNRAGAASPPIDSTIKIPLFDAASCHFLSRWVLLPPEGTNRGIFEFLLPIQKSAAQGSPFYLAFKACSLSSLAQQGHDPLMNRQAASYYVKALAATSSALSRPSVATNDATLSTVMLLGIYEIQSASTHGVDGWGSHISGSMQLMNSRSWKKLNTDLDEQRIWSKGRLQHMAYHFGLRSAAFIAQPSGPMPTTKIMQDYDSRSAVQWRHLRPAMAEAALVEPPQDLLFGDLAGAAPGYDLGRVPGSLELPIHPRSQWTNPAQPHGQGPC